MSPKLMKRLGIVIGVFFILILIMFMMVSCGSGGSYKGDKLEKKMRDSAIKYYEKNKKDLPIDDGDQTSISLKKLISEGYIKEPTDLYKDESVSCSGEVAVSNNNGNYLYSPYLSCKSDKKDNEYTTELLKDKIIEDQLTEKGAGLYEVGNTYVERGEIKNNYVQINGALYRIVRINEDGTIRLLSENYLKSVVWDNRYNTDVNKQYGINKFVATDDSRLKTALDRSYKESSDVLKSLIVTQDLCIGARNVANTTKDNSTECAATMKEQFGLLTVSDYLQASLEESCILPSDISCTNYNWLAKSDYETWLITIDDETSYQAYMLNRTVKLETCSYTNSAHVVFNLDKNVIYESGDGTVNSPFIIRYIVEPKKK